MTSRTVPEYDDLDNYAADDFDDPFRTPPPEAQETKNVSANKRKQGEALGLDEEVEVAKRVRVPRVKLDEARLLSENGIPELRRRAVNLNFKGKGHEFSDTARLLSFYQLWLDDLFPKAKFLDALSMVEKTGHKKIIAHKRLEWINEGKPKPWEADDAPEESGPGAEVGQTAGVNTATEPVSPTDVVAPAKEQGPKTPERDVPDEDDIYGATPVAQVRTQASTSMPEGYGYEEDEEDDLDALMAEADAAGQAQRPTQQQSRKSIGTDFEDEEAALAEMDGLW
ncbi:chromosome segregation in meiosis protein 3 [Colletotrichum karsti]|uniref:Chromosome segregation in meiosis protein n=1 Tax=Colletotrichum karsti TaxID=1095194 RepID=A0A9P6HV14_9PEZI|nr:chromosome segregation in meiosis protein 3 [Colletotrichum karsti]KAF9869276.1 chromosome segregation in meiosis protein 3 [Colletotrichum karsti]